MVISPLSAKLTRDTETFGSMDIYCVIVVGATTKQSPTLQGAGKHPKWSGVVFKFDCRSKNEYIDIWIRDEDPGEDDLVAQCRYTPKNLLVNDQIFTVQL